MVADIYAHTQTFHPKDHCRSMVQKLSHLSYQIAFTLIPRWEMNSEVNSDIDLENQSTATTPLGLDQ
jgi:hypothetical protein